MVPSMTISETREVVIEASPEEILDVIADVDTRAPGHDPEREAGDAARWVEVELEVHGGLPAVRPRPS